MQSNESFARKKIHLRPRSIKLQHAFLDISKIFTARGQWTSFAKSSGLTRAEEIAIGNPSDGSAAAENNSSNCKRANNPAPHLITLTADNAQVTGTICKPTSTHYDD